MLRLPPSADSPEASFTLRDRAAGLFFIIEGVAAVCVPSLQIDGIDVMGEMTAGEFFVTNKVELTSTDADELLNENATPDAEMTGAK